MKKEILFIILLAVFLCGFVTPARAFVEFYPDSLDFLSGNIFLAAAIVFLLGFSLNLTPCVYPLVPVTVSFFSRRSASTPASRLANGLAFFCGLIIFYTLLGLLASCTGFIFGALFQYSSVRVGLALLMLFLALVMFDLIRFDSPGLLQVLSGFVGEKLGSFGLGLTMGLAAAPCVGPPVVALLTFVAEDGDLLRGTLYFLFLAAGLGTPYLFLAVYAPLLQHLPVSGVWMKWVEEFFGFILLGLALYFVTPLFGVFTYNLLLSCLIFLGVIRLAFYHHPPVKIYFIFRLVIVLLLAGTLGIIFWQPAVPMEDFNWLTGTEFMEQRPLDGPALIYMRADWCLPCQQMERNVFARRDIREKLEEIINVKIDLTDSPDPVIEKWLLDKSIPGVPTFIFQNCSGQEMPELRHSGYLPAGRLLKKTQSAIDSCKP